MRLENIVKMQSLYILCVFACLVIFESVIASDNTNIHKAEDIKRNKRADVYKLVDLDNNAIEKGDVDLDMLKNLQKRAALVTDDEDDMDDDAWALREELGRFQNANKRRRRRSSSWWWWDCPDCDQNKLVDTTWSSWCRCPARSDQ